MKLRKDQRHTAYIIIWCELENSFLTHHGIFLCHTIHDIFGLNNYGTGDIPIDKVIKKHFPELNRKRNEEWRDHGNIGLEVRRKHLEKCIIETSNF